MILLLSCYSGQVLARLVGKGGVTSPNLTAGRLEIYYNGQWGTVTPYNAISDNEALTACRHLGFSGFVEYGDTFDSQR